MPINALVGFINGWAPRNPMPTARGGLTSSVVNNIIYVIGGYNEYIGEDLSANEAYEPAENIEITKIPINTAIASSRSTPNTAIDISAGSDPCDIRFG